MKPLTYRTMCNVLALLFPFVTCWVQWQFWPIFRPFVWFLFFPTVFFSSRIGGKYIGLVSTAISALLVVYFFIPPQLSFSIEQKNNLYSVLVFLFMGGAFSYTHDRLERAKQRTLEAQEAARVATGQLQEERIGRLLAEQKQTEAHLIKSEERFRLLFDRAPVPLCFVTNDGVLADYNDRFVQMFGYRHEDIPTLAEWWQRAYPDESYREWVQETWKAAVERAAATESDIEPIEYNVTCKDGVVRTVLISGIALDDDFLATFYDVTERRLAEDALRSSEASLKQAQRLAKVGNWSWDTQSGVHTWSEEIYHIYGRAPDLPPAVYPEVANYFTQESWARLSEAVENGLTNGGPYECDAEVVRDDGTLRWIVARGTAEQDDSGKVVRLYGTVQDITERKLAEEEVRKLNATLEQRVEERTAELLGANKELDAFAYAVSHDLRAPLRAMNGFSQALVEDYSAQLPGEARVYLEQITLASRHMGQLIDGLLTLSRSTRGEMHRDLLSLSALSAQIRDELAGENPHRSVVWQIEPDMVVRGDSRMLEVVMRNLLGNAWKYTAGSPSTLIRVYTEERDGSRCYCVADNGAGFDMRHAERLFKPFQRLHRQDEFPGIGIGLATVQRIVNRHGGEICAEAAPGGGAIFRFSVPDSAMF